MKKIGEVERDLIRTKLSDLAGYDVGEVYPELFLHPEFGAFRAHLEKHFLEKAYIVKVEEALTGTIKEVAIVHTTMSVVFVNREHQWSGILFSTN